MKPFALSLLLLLLAPAANGQADTPSTGVTLIITSVPDTARVTLNDTVVGWTPLTLNDRRPGTFDLKVWKRAHEGWAGRITLNPGDTIVIHAELKLLLSNLSIVPSDPDDLVAIDDAPASAGSVLDREVRPGWHKIVVRNDSSGRTLESMVHLNPGESRVLRPELGVMSGMRIFGSFILPGSAQFSDRAYLKGTGIVAGFLAAGAWVVFAVEDLSMKTGIYDELLDDYDAATSEAEAFYLHDALERAYDDMESARTARTAAAVTLGAVYLFNVIDAVLNHSIVDDLKVLPPEAVRKLSLRPAVGPDRIGVAVSYAW